MRGFSLRSLFAISGAAGLCLVAAAATFQTWSVALILAYVALYRLVRRATGDPLAPLPTIKALAKEPKPVATASASSRASLKDTGQAQ